MNSHLSFSINTNKLRERILIPKYYDPELQESVKIAENSFDTPELGEILISGPEGSRLGNWLERENYGTGRVPFVRTSDLSHWRIRNDVKKGVSEAIYEKYASKQDVRAGDLLFVAHGTYLIGDVAIVTANDIKLVLQDHVFKLRVDPDSGISPYLLLAALSTNFVKRQVRSKQFSADIIDKIGERHLSLRIPLPKDINLRQRITDAAKKVVEGQDSAQSLISTIGDISPNIMRHSLNERRSFRVNVKGISENILIPKYYDPIIEDEIRAEEDAGDKWITLGSLVKSSNIHITSGVEIGKMAYGTGSIPFVRTSDFVNWEVKLDTKHGMSEAIYKQYESKASLRSGDILVVRDGTYLVGSSAMVSEDDIPALISGGVFRIRSTDFDIVNPNFLLAALNLPLVRRQMQARQFTRDVIDTLGHRILEIRIPSPFSVKSEEISKIIREAMNLKAIAKRGITESIGLLEPPIPAVSKGRPGWSMR